jgi:flagellar protein FlbT
MSSIRLSLRSGEKVYINGAVLSVDRKVSLELLNDAVFLLESHILQAHEATTPLRQLYFVAQLLLIDPSSAPQTRCTFDAMMDATLAVFDDDTPVASRLRDARANVANNRLFDALKGIRALFPVEAAMLQDHRETPHRAA